MHSNLPDARTAPLWLLAGALLAPALSARAFTYSDKNNDVLLVFRKPGRNDIIHNLGPMSTFLGVLNGQTIPVTNWDRALTLAAYDGDLSDGVQFAVLAATPTTPSAARKAWVTAAEGATPLAVTSSTWQGYYSKISAAGLKAQQITQTNQVQSLSQPSTEPSAYTFIMSNAGTTPALVGQLGGSAQFLVEGPVPGTLRFAEIVPSTVIPKPEATIIGQFHLGADGLLTYTAGAGTLPPVEPVSIAGIVRQGAVLRVTFPTVAGTRYRLLAAPNGDIGAPVGQWTIVGSAIDGTGAAATLEDVAGTGFAFYRIESFR